MLDKALKLTVKTRNTIGTSGCRRSRRNNGVPGIIYGNKNKNIPIIVEHNHILQSLKNEEFYSQLLTIDVDGNSLKAVLKEVQRHPVKNSIIHIDFMQVSDTDVITMHIPIHFINAELCPGLKDGGVINHHSIEIKVRSEVRHLPKFIPVDLSKLHIDQTIHLKDLELPQGVKARELLHGENSPVVSIHRSKVKETSAPTEEVATTKTVEPKKVTEPKKPEAAKAPAKKTK